MAEGAQEKAREGQHSLLSPSGVMYPVTSAELCSLRWSHLAQPSLKGSVNPGKWDRYEAARLPQWGKVEIWWQGG